MALESGRTWDTDELAAAWARSWRPPPPMTPVEWAEERYAIVKGAIRGPFRVARTPWLREPLERVGADDSCESVVMMCASQMGKSTLQIILLGYVADIAPCTLLFVAANLVEARKFSRIRVKDLLRGAPTVESKVFKPRAKEGTNTALHKEFPGGEWVFAGGQSATSMASLPAKIVAVDEVDRCEVNVGGEGDAVDLAIQRSASFEGQRKIVLASTPTEKGASRIETAYLEGDQREYWMPCPGCGESMRFLWEQMDWTTYGVERPVQVCPANGCIVEEHDKLRMLEAGEWRASAPYDGRTRSYHVSGLYAYPGLGWSWSRLCADFERVKDSEDRLRAWINTRLGLTFDSGGEQIDAEALYQRREDYAIGCAPTPVVVVTAGVDTQDDRLEVIIRGWSLEEESWLLGRAVIWGDPAERVGQEGAESVWTLLDRMLRAPIPRADGAELLVAAAVIDAGGHHTADVLDYTERRFGRRFWAGFGRDGVGRAVFAGDVRRSVKHRNRRFFNIGVDAAKVVVYARVRRVLEAPVWPSRGRTLYHWHTSTPLEYFEQLTSEELVTEFDRGGRPVKRWKLAKAGARNEALDCEVYAYAALRGWRSIGGTMEAAADAVEATREAAEAPVEPARRPEAWIPVSKGWIGS